MPFRFEVGEADFLREGRPHRILGGALHYFRVLPAYWEDRLRKYSACGLNTVETYVPWNLHEPTQGEFDFSGMLDLRRFIRVAGDLDLDVIIRPGPYICAEWENGGLPAWLLKDPGMRLRTSYPPFVDAAVRYFRRIAEEIRDLQCSRGGPVIAVQVENEYGSFGNDRAYLATLEHALQDSGIEVLLFSSDDAADYTLQGGSLSHVFKTVNFGSRPTQAFATLRRYQPTGPLMCTEFWLGWFDHWGKPHHSRDSEDAAETLDQVLATGASVVIYMMHGGTNFGFLNGANDTNGTYASITTSYDYDAPLDERGAPTAKFFAIREVLRKQGVTPGELPAQEPAVACGAVRIEESRSLFDLLPELPSPILSPYPLTMEEAGQSFGYILYRTRISDREGAFSLTITEVRDRAQVFLDGCLQDIVDRNAPHPVTLNLSGQASLLDILVENLGRVNHGAQQPDRKGITQCVRLAAQAHAGWEIYPLDFTRLPDFSWHREEASPSGPTFYRGQFGVEKPQDTYLQIDGIHGAAWVNGFCLGRYWKIGPQKRLFVPGSLLREGRNELVIFDLEATEKPGVEFFSAPAWEMAPVS